MSNINLTGVASSLLVAAIIAAAAVFSVLQFVGLQNKWHKITAVNDCIRYAGTYEFIDTKNSVKTTAPQKEIYQICIADKGFTTVWK